MRSNDQVTIWDLPTIPDAHEGCFLLWRGYSKNEYDNVISIPGMVENNANRLREKYLDWFHQLGVYRVGSKNLVEHFVIREGFSYWWSSLLVEKCNYAKSPWIEDVIRLMVLDEWLQQRQVSAISLVSSNSGLAKSIHSWCSNSNVEFEWVRQPDSNKSTITKRLYGFLSDSIQAILWFLIHIVKRWPLKGVGVDDWSNSENDMTFVTYSANTSQQLLDKGEYLSRYWMGLPDRLHERGRGINWLHLYVEDNVLCTPKEAASAFGMLNKNGSNKDFFVSLDGFLGIDVIYNAIIDWIKLIGVERRIRCKLHFYCGNFDIWPLIENDWKLSFIGKRALSAALSFNLFRKALEVLPKQSKGVYLQENQGWEFGLIHTWKNKGHGELIGFPHSTVRFWDFRYFFSPKSYIQNRFGSLPMPDYVAMSGDATRKAYIDSGYPKDFLVDVEAIRYLYLSGRSTNDRVNEDDQICLLVLGDYLPKNTHRQMQLLNDMVESFDGCLRLIVKPHPMCPIDSSDYPDLQMDIFMKPLDELLDLCDIAYTSSTTSAAIDAYCFGIPVISELDPASLNMSPLRGYHGVVFVSTPDELAQALSSSLHRNEHIGKRPDYFYLDKSLSRWRGLLLDEVVVGDSQTN